MHTVRLLRYFSSQRECFKVHLDDFSNLNTHIVFHNIRHSPVVVAKPLQKGSQYIPPNHGHSKSRNSLAVARDCLSNDLGRRYAERLGQWGWGKMKTQVLCTAYTVCIQGERGKEGGAARNLSVGTWEHPIGEG